MLEQHHLALAQVGRCLGGPRRGPDEHPAELGGRFVLRLPAFDEAIYKVAKWGGAPTPVVESLGASPQYVVLDNAFVYWSYYHALGAIRRTLTDGSGAVEEVASDQNNPR